MIRSSLRHGVACTLAVPALLAFTLSAQADDQPLRLTLPDNLLYAANENTTATPTDNAPDFLKDNEQLDVSWNTGEKWHQYLGLGALALVAVAAVAPKEEGGLHENAAQAAAALAADAAALGFVYHWEDFDFSDGFSDPDNLHVLLGGLGTLAMLAAVSQAPESGHSGTGMFGAVAMLTAVKITW